MQYILLLIWFVPYVHAKNCLKQSLSESKKQYPSVTDRASVDRLDEKGRYNFAVNLYLCRLKQAEVTLATPAWKSVCKGNRAVNRSKCLAHWIEKNAVASATGLLKLVSVIDRAADLDRTEHHEKNKKNKSKNKKLDLFAVQHLQNLSNLAKNFQLEKMPYWQLTTAEAKKLVSNEELPLKMALKQLSITARVYRKNIEKVMASAQVGQGVKNWVLSILLESEKVFEEFDNRKWLWKSLTSEVSGS